MEKLKLQMKVKGSLVYSRYIPTLSYTVVQTKMMNQSKQQ